MGFNIDQKGRAERHRLGHTLTLSLHMENLGVTGWPGRGGTVLRDSQLEAAG